MSRSFKIWTEQNRDTYIGVKNVGANDKLEIKVRVGSGPHKSHSFCVLEIVRHAGKSGHPEFFLTMDGITLAAMRLSKDSTEVERHVHVGDERIFKRIFSGGDEKEAGDEL